MREIERIYKEYEPLVYSYLYTACGDILLAEEITQETFFRIISRCSIDSQFVPERFFKKRESVENQICHLAEQLLGRELLRKEKEQPVERILDFASEIPTLDYLPESSALHDAELNEIYEKIRDLNEPMRYIIFLKYYGKRTYREIAESVKQSENWVRHVVIKGKEQIEQMMNLDRADV